MGVINKVMNDENRIRISPGLHVRIVLKKDQQSGKITLIRWDILVSLLPKDGWMHIMVK